MGKHDWEQTSGMNYRCKKCLTTDGVKADWCDADGISAELARVADRTDCKGKRRKSRKKPKLEYTRRELIVITENHGGHLAGNCSLCGSSGWIDQIDHNAGCILADPKIRKIRIVAIKTDAELIEELRSLEKAGASKAKREEVFKQIPVRYKVEVCSGCGRTPGGPGCGCPCGTSWTLKSKSAIKRLLKNG